MPARIDPPALLTDALSTTDLDELVAQLANLVGDEAVSTDWADRDAAATDWTPLGVKRRKAAAGAWPIPAVVVSPRDESGVARVLSWSRERRIPLQIVGGGSSVVCGINGSTAPVALWTRNLTEIGELNEYDGTITVGGGVNGGVLAHHLEQRGFILPHQPQSLHVSSVGGWVATLATGVLSTGYGGIEDMVTSLRAVLPDGTTVAMDGAPRCSIGPDLRYLFLGSEGAFGVITEVGLQVGRRPQERRLASFELPDFPTAVDAVRRLAQSRQNADLVRLYDPAESMRYSDGEVSDGRCLLLLGWDGDTDIVDALEKWSESLIVSTGGASLGSGHAWHWYDNRQVIDWLSEAAHEDGRVIDTLEVSVPWSRLVETHASLTAIAARHIDAVESHFSHVYPTGACMYIVMHGTYASDAIAIEALERIWDEVTRECVRTGIPVSHHHGIGRLRGRWLADARRGDYALLTALRQSLDGDRLTNSDLLS